MSKVTPFKESEEPPPYSPGPAAYAEPAAPGPSSKRARPQQQHYQHQHQLTHFTTLTHPRLCYASPYAKINTFGHRSFSYAAPFVCLVKLDTLSQPLHVKPSEDPSV